MNIIFAKHDGCEKEYLFEVPNGMHPVRGDVLWVNTSNGEVAAFCSDKQVNIHDNFDLPF